MPRRHLPPAEIIVEPTGIVFLNDKDAAATNSPHSPDWFGRFRKNSVASICCERHCFASDCFFEFRSSGIGDFTSSHISPRARHLPAACPPAGRGIEGVAACLPPSTQ